MMALLWLVVGVASGLGREVVVGVDGRLLSRRGVDVGARALPCLFR